MLLKGKTALISGAGRGIGREIAQNMAVQGADIAALDLDADSLAETKKLAEALGVSVLTAVVNITDREQVDWEVARLFQEMDGIDILVNNAAIFQEAPFLTMTPEQWKRNLDVNLTGLYNVTQAFAALCCAQNDSGSIVSISSVDAFQGCRNFSHYAMAKAGVVGLTRTLALELAPFHVRVNAIAPGITLTDMTRERIALNEKKYLSGIPLGRIGRPKDIANAAVFLASDMADYITGQVLHVNGGVYFG